MGRTAADVQLGQILGNFAGNYNSPKPDSYRSGVQMRLNEDAGQRQERSLQSQLATEDLQRQKLRRALEAEDANRSMTPQDVIKQLGGFGSSQAEELDMALANPDFQPTSVSPQDILAAKSAMRTKGAYDMGGNAVDQIIRAMGEGQDQGWAGAVRSNVDPSNFEQVGRAESALAGRGYDPHDGTSGAGQRDSAAVNTLKYYMSPPPAGLGMTQEQAFARMDKADVQRLKELYALQRANISSFGDPADLGNIDAQVQDIINPGQTPQEPNVLDILRQLQQPGGQAPGPARGGYQAPTGGTVVKRYQ